MSLKVFSPVLSVISIVIITSVVVPQRERQAGEQVSRFKDRWIDEL
jgi:hypothetical protein